MKNQNTLVSIWRDTFSSTPPVGHMLRRDFHTIWTRFHSLPKSKRYADNEEEPLIILSRANTLFGELEDQCVLNCYGANIDFAIGQFNWLIKAISEDEIKALFFDPISKQVLAPYDGGFDLITPIDGKISALEDRHSSWMSDRSDRM